MSTSRRALLSMMSATVAYAAISGIAFARGGGGKGGKGGKDGAMDAGPGIVTSPVSGKQAKTFKSYQGKQCNRDYKRLCPSTPIGKCDLAGRINQLSPSCKAFVEAH